MKLGVTGLFGNENPGNELMHQNFFRTSKKNKFHF